ncbi:MAG: hypothetical protein MHM6MM_006307, partial [Cercozoa sp. M6MM]
STACRRHQERLQQQSHEDPVIQRSVQLERRFARLLRLTGHVERCCRKLLRDKARELRRCEHLELALSAERGVFDDFVSALAPSLQGDSRTLLEQLQTQETQRRADLAANREYTSNDDSSSEDALSASYLVPGRTRPSSSRSSSVNFDPDDSHRQADGDVSSRSGERAVPTLPVPVTSSTSSGGVDVTPLARKLRRQMSKYASVA